MFDCAVDHSFNVKDFGAIGNGIADDTIAIKAAVAAASVAGGVVYAPAGKYRLSETVVINAPGVYIKGDGMYITTFYRTGTYGDTFFVTRNTALGQEVANIGFRDVGFESQGLMTSGAHITIVLMISGSMAGILLPRPWQT
jgi:hypothetical protein